MGCMYICPRLVDYLNNVIMNKYKIVRHLLQFKIISIVYIQMGGNSERAVLCEKLLYKYM